MAEEPEKPCLWCSILTENRRKLCFWRVPHGFKLAVLIASSNPLPWQWEAWLEPLPKEPVVIKYPIGHPTTPVTTAHKQIHLWLTLTMPVPPPSQTRQ